MERWFLGIVRGMSVLVPLPCAAAARSARGPGLLAAALVAGLGHGLAALGSAAGVTIGPLLPTLLLGLLAAQCAPVPHTWRPGLAVAGRPLLRAAIVLSALRLGLVPLSALGGGGFAAIALLVAATLWTTRWFGRRLGLGDDLVWLLAAGHAICGAAAIGALAASRPARASEVTAAITLVTLAGTVLALLLPVLGTALALPAPVYGFWVGSSVHEVAHALAAGHARGTDAGTMATLVKLARVLFLLPVVLVARSAGRRTSAHTPPGRVPVPWFVVAFAGVGLAASAGWVPAAIAAPLHPLAGVLMSLAMAALGLQSPLRDLLALGWRPLLLVALATTFVTGAGFLLALGR